MQQDEPEEKNSMDEQRAFPEAPREKEKLLWKKRWTTQGEYKEGSTERKLESQKPGLNSTWHSGIQPLLPCNSDREEGMVLCCIRRDADCMLGKTSPEVWSGAGTRCPEA